jgi:hypothetical protein
MRVRGCAFEIEEWFWRCMAYALAGVTLPVWGPMLLLDRLPTYRDWAPWFAWYPVRIGNDIVWWERVEALNLFDGESFIYRYPAGRAVLKEDE